VRRTLAPLALLLAAIGSAAAQGTSADTSADTARTARDSAEALRRNGTSLGGLPGLVNVPVAASVPSGMVDLSFNDARTPSLFGAIGAQHSLLVAFGLLPRVTIGLRGTVAGNVRRTGEYRDLGEQLHVQLLEEGTRTPSLAVGIQDAVGVNAFYHARYVVASHRLFGVARATVGYGSGPVRLHGVFGGIEAGIGSWATAMGEYDGERYAAGLRMTPFPTIADRAGVQPSFDFTWRKDLGVALAGGMRVALAGPPDTYRGRREAPSALAGDGRRGPVPATGRNTPALEGALEDAGLENIRVAMADDATIDVAYENRVYNRNELDALGVVMAATAACAPESARRMRVTILRVGLPVLTVTSDIAAFVAFANDRLGASAFADQLGFPAPGDAGLSDAPVVNSSRFKLDVFVRPRVETVILSEVGVLETRTSVLPDAYVQLGRGLVVNARRAVPVGTSRNFPVTIDDPNADRLLLSQAFAVPFAGAPQARTLSQFSIGRFGHEDVGVADEVEVSLPGGLVRVGGTVGVVGPRAADLNRSVALATARLRYPALDLTATLTAGRFLKGDAGATAELSRWFGNTELTAYFKSTEFQSVAGMRVALPLAPRRELPPTRVRPRFPDVHTQEVQSTVLADQNVLRRDVGLPLAADLGVLRRLLDRDRLDPTAVRLHAAVLRAAVRRWAGYDMLVHR
jgi:hypothetical protein